MKGAAPLAEAHTVSGNSGEVNTAKFSSHMVQSSALRPVWLVASEVHSGKGRQGRRRTMSLFALFQSLTSALHKEFQENTEKMTDTNA